MNEVAHQLSTGRWVDSFPDLFGTEFRRVGDEITAAIFLARLADYEDTCIYTYNWKWMVFGSLGCMDTVDFGKKNAKIVLDMFICQKLRHAQVISKIPYSYAIHRPSK